MKIIDKNFIDHLKNHISILDIISSRVKLRRSGKDWFGLCPFHHEKTGSFKVDTTNEYYYCFGCGAHGDAITFLEEFEKITFNEAVEKLASQYGIAIPEKQSNVEDPNKRIFEALNEIKHWFISQLNSNAGLIASDYLKHRKISKDSIALFQLGYAPENKTLQQHLKKLGFADDTLLKTGVFNKSKYGNELVNRYSGRLIFPILDTSSRCVGFGGRILTSINVAKYINSPESDIFIKNKNLYGYSIAKQKRADTIILTEGYLDVISMHQAGFSGTVAPLGTAISDNQIGMCWRLCNTPIIALDGDTAGIKASYRWIDKILPVLEPGKSFKFAQLPNGTDPDTLISNGYVNVLQKSLQNAVALSDRLWDGAFQLYSSDTPEAKAEIIKLLSDKIEKIGDRSVKQMYQQELKKKERTLYRFKNNFKETKEVIPAITPQEKLEKKIIVILLNYPYLIDKVLEDFVKIEFSDYDMGLLKNRIINCYNEYRDNNEKYLSQIQDILTGNAVGTSNIKKYTDDNDALNDWLNLYKKHTSMIAIIEDLQEASSSLKLSFAESDWQRLKALKKESILNRSKK